jgi:hypothetical protein
VVYRKGYLKERVGVSDNGKKFLVGMVTADHNKGATAIGDTSQ